jgi:FkbH-like protein
MWYAAKVPYVNGVFDKACSDLLAAIAALQGRSRRVLVLDLDNTLWGGVVGETGWEGIRLGGHDHVGEAYVDFQKALKDLARKGVQLAIASKNDETVALQAIDCHPEMPLRRDAFAAWRINWQDKADNIAALAEELNLGLGSFVFIDDNPVERERVREGLPEVLVPEWPVDPTQYVSALRALDCFDSVVISQEDRARTAMYVAERERRSVREQAASPQDWLARLETVLQVAPVSASNVMRVGQLFNKTNQLNLSTRRLSEGEITAWAGEPGRSLLTVSASDKFGDMGLVGIVAVEALGSVARITDFILSCRVMGRQVEAAMLYLAAQEAARHGADTLEAVYLPTPRNRPTLDVMNASDLREVEPHLFRASIEGRFAKPAVLTIHFAAP